MSKLRESQQCWQKDYLWPYQLSMWQWNRTRVVSFWGVRRRQNANFMSTYEQVQHAFTRMDEWWTPHSSRRSGQQAGVL